MIKTLVKTTGSTNSRVLDVEKGPLQLLKFTPRKADQDLVWGKEVNDLSVAITPADQKDKFIIRWKNVGKDALQVPWVRLNTRGSNSTVDDLLDHVFLKGPDDKLVPARKYPAQPIRNMGLRSFILGPGRIHEEIIALWDYLDKPTVDGTYKLSFELIIPKGTRGRDFEVNTWTGKIESNELDVKFGK